MLKLEQPVTAELLLSDDCLELQLAILMQNAMHPKNSQRTDAIKDSSYVELTSQEDARLFLSNLLT